MTYQIDKNVPISGHGKGRRRPKNPEFPELLKQMEPGDSVNFPFDKDTTTGSVKIHPKTGRRLSKKGHSFFYYCRLKGVKVVSRVSENGLRIWVMEKK